jgi:hypothetical protein
VTGKGEQQLRPVTVLVSMSARQKDVTSRSLPQGPSIDSPRQLMTVAWQSQVNRLLDFAEEPGCGAAAGD